MGAYNIETALNRYLNIARSFQENNLYEGSLVAEVEKPWNIP